MTGVQTCALPIYFAPVPPLADALAAQLAMQLSDPVRAALATLRDRLAVCDWDKPGIALALKTSLAEHQLKMPQLAMPLRVLLTGQLQTPAIDAVVEVFGRDTVLARLAPVA